jgi:hypothetical protein
MIAIGLSLWLWSEKSRKNMALEILTKCAFVVKEDCICPGQIYSLRDGEGETTTT